MALLSRPIMCMHTSHAITTISVTRHMTTTISTIPSLHRHRIIYSNSSIGSPHIPYTLHARLSSQHTTTTNNKSASTDTNGDNLGTGSPNVLIGIASKVGGVNSAQDGQRVKNAMTVVNTQRPSDTNPNKPTHIIPTTPDGTPLYTSSITYPPDFDHSETALSHPLWTGEYINKVTISYKTPSDWVDRLARLAIKVMRFNFDVMSGWKFGKINERKALNRLIFLEAVAGVPGSVAAIIRHLASLRRMRRDHGWINTLLEEAENERNHLLTVLQKKQPGTPFKGVVWVTQGVWFNFFFAAYLVAPRFCHSMVGYLEEEAVTTYTHVLHEIDSPDGGLKSWATEPAPPHAVTYWKMAADSTMRDVMLLIRADEAHHRDVNHAFASLGPTDQNPFKPGM